MKKVFKIFIFLLFIFVFLFSVQSCSRKISNIYPQAPIDSLHPESPPEFYTDSEKDKLIEKQKKKIEELEKLLKELEGKVQ